MNKVATRPPVATLSTTSTHALFYYERATRSRGQDIIGPLQIETTTREKASEKDDDDSMSDSPIRRFSTASPTNHLKREETLINAYEAEEERIINVLSRKLEQVRPPPLPHVSLKNHTMDSSEKKRSNSRMRSRQRANRT